MDYEKKYNEALERAKAYHRNELSGTRKEIAEYIFPNLRESEDERIRKEIISALKFANDGGVYDKHIAYLEKQKALSELGKYIAAKRTKPGFMFAGNDSVSWEELPLDVRKHDYPYYFSGDLDCYPFVVEKQKEPKLLNNEKYQTVPVETLDRLYASEKELKEIKQKEQKPVDYKEELEKCKKNPLYFIDKYVKIKIKPVEWSEEDEKNWNNIWDVLDGQFNISEEARKKACAWLKSLRPQKKEDLPKWLIDNDYVEEIDGKNFSLHSVGLAYRGYYIPYSDLLKLPKEDEK